MKPEGKTLLIEGNWEIRYYKFRHYSGLGLKDVFENPERPGVRWAFIHRPCGEIVLDTCFKCKEQTPENFRDKVIFLDKLINIQL